MESLLASGYPTIGYTSPTLYTLFFFALLLCKASSRFHVDRPIVFFLFGYLFGSIGDEWQFGRRVSRPAV